MLLDNSSEMKKWNVTTWVWHYASRFMALKRVLSLERQGRKPDWRVFKRREGEIIVTVTGKKNISAVF